MTIQEMYDKLGEYIKEGKGNMLIGIETEYDGYQFFEKMRVCTDVCIHEHHDTCRIYDVDEDAYDDIYCSECELDKKRTNILELY